MNVFPFCKTAFVYHIFVSFLPFCPSVTSPLSLFSVSVCPPPYSLSRLGHSANKEWHIGLVTPQQHDERPQGREGREGAREWDSGDGPGLNSLFGQCEEGSVSGIVQNQPLFRVETTQVSILEEWRQSCLGKRERKVQKVDWGGAVIKAK